MGHMISVAIDGPAGAGKTEAAKAAAKRLRFAFVDTGALYRAVGVAVLRAGKATEDPAEVEACLPDIRLSLAFIEGAQHVYLDGEDITETLYTPQASKASSDVAKVGAVREFLLEPQRELARRQNSIFNGRDIGTVVLPDASLKIFLTAAPEERAARIYKRQRENGSPQPYEEVLADLLRRDKQDSERAAAPLKIAPGAVVLDTTRMDLEESIQAVVALIKEKL
ncbi:MAG: (d)CMP kinase [Oscillospiraceae bacterium]|nr:(d)CMP kinase [Oscillospiraceae bacterium]